MYIISKKKISGIPTVLLMMEDRYNNRVLLKIETPIDNRSVWEEVNDIDLELIEVNNADSITTDDYDEAISQFDEIACDLVGTYSSKFQELFDADTEYVEYIEN